LIFIWNSNPATVVIKNNAVIIANKVFFMLITKCFWKRRNGTDKYKGWNISKLHGH